MFDGAAVATAGAVSTEQIAQSQADAFFGADDVTSADSTPAAPTGEPQPTSGDQALFDALAAYDTSAARQEILFLSPSVRDYQQLLDDISPNVTRRRRADGGGTCRSNWYRRDPSDRRRNRG